jgi:hypothetical protein
VNHGFSGGLVPSFYGSEGRWRGERYIKLVKEKECVLLARKEVSFFYN